MCFLIFSTILYEKLLILRGIEGNIVINVWRYVCQVPATSVRYRLLLSGTGYFCQVPATSVRYRLRLSGTGYFCHVLMKTEFFKADFGKIRKNIKFHGSRYSGSRVVPCGRTDMTTLTDAFRNYAKAPRNGNSNFCPHNLFIRSAYLLKQTNSECFAVLR